MKDCDPEAIDRLTILAGLGAARSVVPLSGGANNRVFRVEADRGRALLKAYFRHPADPRDRLRAEFSFAQFARAAGVPCVAKPLANDPAAGLGLFEFIEGERIEAATKALVAQAVGFVLDLNGARWRPAASLLPNASEACFSFEEHLGLVGNRVNRLGEIAPDTDIDREAMRFVRRSVAPLWETVHYEARVAARASGLPSARPLDLTTRCVSPSDFGFHNALVGPDGRAVFLDFEYAGWDDPAKLVCDFFCQPAVPVPESQFERFLNAVANCFPNPAEVVELARLLLPVYRVKWVCIQLNEFLSVGLGRRRFAAAGDEPESRKCRQLALARAALAAMQEHHEVSA